MAGSTFVITHEPPIIWQKAEKYAICIGTCNQAIEAISGEGSGMSAVRRQIM